MIDIKTITEMNKQFGRGNPINQQSLEFAISSAKSTKDWIKQLAFIIRSILIDHVFEEGNKRTAAVVLITSFEIRKIAYDPYKVDFIITEITKKNIRDINKIRRMIKNATR